MTKQTSITSGWIFKSHQIVCLELQKQRLYGEVIQVVTQKQRCWVRPWLLVTVKSEQEQGSYVDLRQTSDLVWPCHLFRPALDTEVIPLLKQLSIFDGNVSNNDEVNQEFKQFINRVWQTYDNYDASKSSNPHIAYRL